MGCRTALSELGLVYYSLRGRPRLRGGSAVEAWWPAPFTLDGATFDDNDPDPDTDTPVVALSSVGRGFLRGRPRPLLGTEGSTTGWTTLFNFGGRPRFRGATSGASSEAELSSSSLVVPVSTGFFLGRPRPRLAGAAAVVASLPEIVEVVALRTAVVTALWVEGIADGTVDLRV